ncbi:MAG TPA: NYN domain-containing protein [Thermohalobaculum sp.]|nr:NYN domain-containing protein [Thermohalobaculum sp.]
MMATIDNAPRSRIAVLVDADNVESHQIEFALEQAAAHGTVTLRRAFGRLASIRGRERALTELGFSVEVALPAARNRKDTADLLLAQYAVRLAERQAVDLIALVSSDSDFATIARGIAESGVPALGFGRADTPQALREACMSFTPFPGPAPAKKAAAEGKPAKVSDRDAQKLKRVIDASLNRKGRARAQTIGTQVNRAFDGDYKKHFGVTTLSKLVALLDGYEMRGRGTEAEVVAKGSGGD